MPTSKISIVDFHKDYKCEEDLGKGGEGEAQLWKRTKSAISTVADCVTLVVVKTVRKTKVQIPREAVFLEILKQHNHPNIIRMLGYTHTDLGSENVRILLEYCDEGDLCKVARNFDRSQQPMKEFMIWKITTSLLAALAFLHEGKVNGRRPVSWTPIIHRDIKPEMSCLAPSQMDLAFTNSRILASANTGTQILPTQNPLEHSNGNHLSCLTSQQLLPIFGLLEPYFTGSSIEKRRSILGEFKAGFALTITQERFANSTLVGLYLST
jgi:serine/threonine protein kinase